MLELTFRTLCDVRAKNVGDGAYLYSQTKDNQHSVLSAAQQVINEGLAEKVLIAKSDPKSGYPGNFDWEKELIQRGIQRYKILGVDLSDTVTINTLIEAEAMVNYAKKNQYKDLYIISSPFHQLRAFMTSVTAALKYYPEIRVYSYNGTSLSWLETVVHSQGKTSGQRKELIKGELDRIRIYQQKGDLASESDILDYLDKREKNHFLNQTQR